MVCEHKNIKKEKIEKNILDLTFEHETLVCQDCGAYLRGVSFEKAYMQWLEGIYKDNKRRSKFQVQCHFSKNLINSGESPYDEEGGDNHEDVRDIDTGVHGTMGPGYLLLKVGHFYVPGPDRKRPDDGRHDAGRRQQQRHEGAISRSQADYAQHHRSGDG